MAKGPLNHMTPGERVTYAHGRIKSDMLEFQNQIDLTFRVAVFERNLSLILTALFIVVILAVFYFLKPIGWLDFSLLGIIAASFLIVCAVAYNAMSREIAMLDGLQFLYSKLANDETISFVSETMKVESAEIERIHLSGLTDAKLRDGLMLAGNVIDAIIRQIENGKQNGQSDST